MATRGRRKADHTSKISLVKALAFAEGVLKSDRSFAQQHCYIGRGQLVAFDGTLAAGHPISEDIEAVPHSGKLLKALERSDENVSVTLNDTKRISVKSGKFRAVISCLDIGAFYSPTADTPIATISDTLREGFKAITHITKDTADKVHFASVLVRAGSMCTTDGRTMFEYWHGLDLPLMALPKAAAIAVTKTEKKLVRFGYSGHSATFHFEDGSWIRTLLYSDTWPDVDHVLAGAPQCYPVPPSLFAAVRAVAPFCEESGAVWFHPEAVATGASLTEGATHEVAGLLSGPVFNFEQLAQIEPLVKTISFEGSGQAFFYGDNVRGKIVGFASSKQYGTAHDMAKQPKELPPTDGEAELARRANPDNWIDGEYFPF